MPAPAKYYRLNFKIPEEASDYSECSDFAIAAIGGIMEDSIKSGNNRILINTNLKLGLPMENINKVAGPFVEAWAAQIFSEVAADDRNRWYLINVEAKERLDMADVILQFKKKRKIGASVTAEVDVKATAEDIKASGKSPNITSYERIRSAYIEDPDYLFVILSLKHRVYSTRDAKTKMMNGVMEVVGHHAYDLKFLSSTDISYNPALGTGQLQVRDIHYVTAERRSTWEFCKLLDQKYMNSSHRSFAQWLALAKKSGWIKTDDPPKD
ncbi:MAG TPA: hypothetical protein VN765_16105 [Candidatus Acidoferrum sp.]|nr:hypothetical protein [Candidatus Acidoferrum sp.]